jgi:hypothetical protein
LKGDLGVFLTDQVFEVERCFHRVFTIKDG